MDGNGSPSTLTTPTKDGTEAPPTSDNGTPITPADKSSDNPKRAAVVPLSGGRGRPRRGSGMNGRMIGSKAMGRLSDNPDIDRLRPMKLTKMCNIPIVNDLTNERVICFAGDFVLVNVAPSTLSSNFAVDESFAVFMGGELAALVDDWTEDSTEIEVRRQKSNDDKLACSGAVEIFPLSAVATVENHCLVELKAHAFCGFHFTSTSPRVPFVTAWLSVHRKQADHSSHVWNGKTDPTMRRLKSLYIESLPCSINRFDVVVSSAVNMENLKFISEVERVALGTYPDALHNFECLILQFLPEVGCPNWNNVFVVFLSNWRIALSKRGEDDFPAYLNANLWYLSRGDFENFLFQVCASIEVQSDLESLRGARMINDIFLDDGQLAHIMYGQAPLNCRYDHKKALAMWLHHKASDEIVHLIKDRTGERENAAASISVNGSDESESEKMSKKPTSPPPKRLKKAFPGRGRGAGRRKSDITTRRFPGAADTDLSMGTARARSGEGLSDANLMTFSKSIQAIHDSSSSASRSLETLLRENGSHITALTKSLGSLVESVDKISKKVSAMEGTLKDMAKAVGKEELLRKEHNLRSGGSVALSVVDESGGGRAPKSSKGKGVDEQFKEQAKARVPSPSRDHANEAARKGGKRKASEEKGAGKPTPVQAPPRESSPSESSKSSSDSSSVSSCSEDSSPEPSPTAKAAKLPMPSFNQGPGFYQPQGANRGMGFDPMMFLKLASQAGMGQPHFNLGYGSTTPSNFSHDKGEHRSSKSKHRSRDDDVEESAMGKKGHDKSRKKEKKGRRDKR